MKIALITDLHAEEDFPAKYGVDVWKNWAKILADVRKREIQNIVFLGDIGSQVAHKKLFKSLDEGRFNYQLVLGNHDNFSEVIQSYRPESIDKRVSWHWSEESGGFKKIFLDTSSDAIDATQIDFLKQEIQTDKPVLLFIHHPVIQTNTTPHREYPLGKAEEIESILHSHDKPVHIYCGHLHMDDIQFKINITQTITPAASLQLKKQSEKTEVDLIGFGYRILDLKDPLLSSEVVWFKS